MRRLFHEVLAAALAGALLAGPARAAAAAATHEVRTNEVSIAEAPAWLRPGRVDKVVARIQKVLEWDIRRVKVEWHRDQARFEALHGFGPSVLAFARKSDNTV